MTVDNAVEIPQEYRSPEGMRTLANYLRAHIRVKSGIEHEKRVEYFKGIRLVECVLEAKKWPKSIPKITDARVAVEVADLLLQSHFFHRSEKVKDKKGYLKISQKTVFEEKGYYTWIFVGNMMWSNIATGLVIAVVIGFTLLPIWPDAAKKVLWYFSVTFLIGTLAFCLIRVIAFIVMWILGYDFWIFPRLFDESLSFQDSFKPIYSFDKGSAGQGYYRLGMIVLLTGFTYWAYTQPTEFDGFIQAQKEFIDDLYSGKLIADVAFDPRDQIDRNKKVPSLQDLLKELENDEKSITEKATEVEEDGNVEASNNVNSDSSNEDNEGSGEFIYVDTESSTVEN